MNDEEEDDVCTFSQIMSPNFGTDDMEIKETPRKRQREEKGGDELRQENKQLRKLVMRQQAQLSTFKPDGGAGGSGMHVSHPASPVMSDGWGQHVLHKSDSSWLQPIGSAQQHMSARGQLSSFRQPGHAQPSSFFQSPAQPPLFHRESASPFRLQPAPHYGQQHQDWDAYPSNAPSQVFC